MVHGYDAVRHVTRTARVSPWPVCLSLRSGRAGSARAQARPGRAPGRGAALRPQGHRRGGDSTRLRACVWTALTRAWLKRGCVLSMRVSLLPAGPAAAPHRVSHPVRPPRRLLRHERPGLAAAAAQVEHGRVHGLWVRGTGSSVRDPVWQQRRLWGWRGPSAARSYRCQSSLRQPSPFSSAHPRRPLPQ
jgi:hypothetical protein